MTHQTPPEHFEGKSVAEHLKVARTKGAQATAEMHGTEMTGDLAAVFDSAKDLSMGFLLLLTTTLILPGLPWSPAFFLYFVIGWTLWKTGRSALIAWARLERYHRLIEEERWEIQHHRHQEKTELRELYAAKGLTGKLLDEVVEVLMADENRLLQVMLEEELGLTLEAVDHPLKQAFGAFLGAALSGSALYASLLFLSPFWTFAMGALIMGCATLFAAKLERNRALSSLIWQLSTAAFVFVALFYLGKWIEPALSLR